MRGRHTEDEEAIQKRLHEVKIELERAKDFDYRVVNDEVERAITELEKVIDEEHKKC